MSFHFNPKEGQCQRMCKLAHLHSCTYQQSNAQNSPSQASQCINQEPPDVQTGFRKGKGTRDQVANVHANAGSQKKQENSRQTSASAPLTMPKPLTVWITTNQKILKEMGLLDHRTFLLRNLYAGQEATVRTGHGTTDWFQIGKGVHQGCILLLCLFNLYAEHIMRKTGLDEAQAGIKIAGRNINNLRNAGDTTFMAESKEELKSLLMKSERGE